jgi:hypothetical protein
MNVAFFSLLIGVTPPIDLPFGPFQIYGVWRSQTVLSVHPEFDPASRMFSTISVDVFPFIATQ